MTGIRLLPLRSGLIAAATLALLQGCALPAASIDPGRLYARPQSGEGAERAPVVVIPGMAAVRLVDAGDGPSLPALPMRPGATLAELRDGLRPAGVALSGASRRPAMKRAAGAYGDLVAAFQLGGYRLGENQSAGTAVAGPANLFRFEYDWRRDLVESAANLHRFLLERRAELQAARPRDLAGGSAPIRFDLVAHAAGGLVLRYYLRYGDADLPADGSLPPLTWAGADLVGRAILVGPPNAGGVGALLGLVGGEGASAILPGVSPFVLGTYPSIYQQLPRGRHESSLRIQGQTRQPVDDLFDAALWENLGWGLASAEDDESLARLLPLEPDPVARRRIALDHLRKSLQRARRFCEALDVPGRTPAGLSLHLMADDTIPTDAVAGIDWATGRVSVIEQRPGDGNVLRSSALLDERIGARWSPSLLSPIDWSSVMFFHADGAALERDSAFIDNLLWLLLEQPRRSND